MKLFYSFLIISIVSISGINAQSFKKGTITTTNETLEGKLLIDNASKNVSFKSKEFNKSYRFNTIKSVTINGSEYSKIQFKNEEYVASLIEDGKVSLYDLTNDSFLIKKGENEGQVFHLTNDKSQIAGTLLLLFNDCNSVRDQVNNTGIFNRFSLQKLTYSYNNCAYETYNPTENELEQANTYNTDIYRFYAGLQSSFNSTTINNFSSNSTTGFGLGLGIAGSPSFMGKIQGNLFFDFDFAMIFTGDNDFDDGSIPLNYKVNTYRFSLGMEYLFNKKGTIQPFLGIGYGYTSDYYKGSIGNLSFKDHDQNYFFVPKIGMLYQLKNGKHIGLTVSYISEYENNLSFFVTNENDETERIPFIINSSAITVGLNYYF